MAIKLTGPTATLLEWDEPGFPSFEESPSRSNEGRKFCKNCDEKVAA